MSKNERTKSSAEIAEVSPLVEQIGKAFVAAWLFNQEERIESYLAKVPEELQAEAHDVMIRLEVYIRASHGETPEEEEYHRRFPDYEVDVEQAFRSDSQSNRTAMSGVETGPAANAGSAANGESSMMGCSADFEMATKTDVIPERIGRYKIESILGTGGFGVVCLARDMELNRQVALKFARTSRFRNRQEMDELISEARTAAQLSHPGIVAVHDVLHEDDVIAIIQQFIEGQDLAHELKAGNPTYERTAQLIAGVCTAIAFAHSKGFIHRDLKPANILLNEDGEPHIADFGLAIHESFQRRRRGDKSGTPRYMSPELVRGESHRLDGRSDIWSIGVMMYEMLTGHRPFSGETRAELFDEIKHREPKPPRQIKDNVPMELERICLKCLCKPVSRRYATATDIAEDLRVWLQSTSQSHTDLDSSSGSGWEVIPRGLRSFDAEDAEFFLSLLPGPTARNGLPESIRFWKNRIEQTDSDALQIGLLYGPSGCGKSSFIKAGLLPHLAPFVQPIRIEATAADTEVRLIKALRTRYNKIPTELTLPEVFQSIREGLWASGSDRILIVIDQFEQWLHNRSSYQHTELVEALRHCDGKRIQCLLTVRDDFWLATSRFLKALEVDLVEGQNAALVDLFEKSHACKVLRQYGRGYGVLDEKPDRQQEDFIATAVDELAEADRVICVRLSLFAEMFKEKPWTPATLKRVGGISGVGVAFLEDTFSAKSARPEYRLHEQAARKVLAALLPDPSVDIRGNMRSRNELLRESGYANRPNAFKDVLRILDNELRLITPTDPEGMGSNLETDPGGSKDYYQLTHDYLVPSLRIWLYQKERESFRGRARLRLDERHATWSHSKENRFLPSFGEYLNVRTLTKSSSWSEGERELIRKADRFYGWRLALVTGILMACGFLGRYWYNSSQADTYVSRFVEAETADVRDLINEVNESGLQGSVSSRLQGLSELDVRQSLNVDMALSHMAVNRKSLWDRLFSSTSNSTASDTAEIARLLKPTDQEVQDLWDVLLTSKSISDDQKLLRAAVALSWWTPDDSRWQDVRPGLVNAILNQGPYFANSLMDAMPNTREQLLRGLVQHLIQWQYGDDKIEPPTDAISLIQQYQNAWPGLTEHLQTLIGQFDQEKGQVGYYSTPQQVRPWETASQKQANVAAILTATDQGQPMADSVLRLLKTGNHEMTRSLLIEQFVAFHVDAGKLIDAVSTTNDPEIRSALWMALGPYVSSKVKDEDVLSVAKSDFQDHPNGLVHSASEWLLRKMDQGQWIQQQKARFVSGEFHAEKEWRVDQEGQTLVKVKAPDDFVMSFGRRATINYDFEISTKEVTWEQFVKHNSDYVEIFESFCNDNGLAIDETLTLPATQVNWYQAAEYCNWLSLQHGLPEDQWCYQREEPGNGGLGPGPVYPTWGPNKPDFNFAPRLFLAPDYQQRAGYRLPLESEFDLIAYPYMNIERQSDLLFRVITAYALFGDIQNQLNAGRKKPIRYGVFDLMGNTEEWCSDPYISHIQIEQKSMKIEVGGAYLEPTTLDAAIDEKLESEPTADGNAMLNETKNNRVFKGIRSSERNPWDSRGRGGKSATGPKRGFRVVRVLQKK